MPTMRGSSGPTDRRSGREAVREVEAVVARPEAGNEVGLCHAGRIATSSGAVRNRANRPSGLLGGLQVEEHLGELDRVRRAVVGVAVVEQDVHVLRLRGRLAHLRRPVLQLVVVVQVAEPLDGLDVLLLPGLGAPAVEADERQVGEVVATIGGTLDLKPCGPSTMTIGIARSPRKRIVRSRFFSLNQVALRNSTEAVSPTARRRSTAPSISSRFSTR